MWDKYYDVKNNEIRRDDDSTSHRCSHPSYSFAALGSCVFGRDEVSSGDALFLVFLKPDL